MNSTESNSNIILFDMAKNEMFDINDNLKILRRKLKGSYTIAMQVTNIYNLKYIFILIFFFFC